MDNRKTLSIIHGIRAKKCRKVREVSRDFLIKNLKCSSRISKCFSSFPALRASVRCDSQSECSILKQTLHASMLWLVRCARKLQDRKRAQNLISFLFPTSLILLSDIRGRSNGRERVDLHNAGCLHEERIRVGGSAEREIVV